MTQLTEQCARLALDTCTTGPEEFEIAAISAGQGNGWVFSPEVLQNSLALWDGVECFVDHAAGAHSVRDLAGLCTRPSWNASGRSIHLHLRAAGPSAPLLASLGRDVLEQPAEARPRVGFSADLLFTAEGAVVRQILKVNSVDLVFNPARGGAFLRALNSRELTLGGTNMETQSSTLTTQTTQQPPVSATGAGDPPEGDLQAALCEQVLEGALLRAHLPQAAENLLRQQFAGRVFRPQELEGAIAGQRRVVSELTAGSMVAGVRAGGHIQGMVNESDRLEAAVHDLLGAERPSALQSVRPPRLSGIRELYTTLTGDQNFAGGFYPEHAQLSTTATLPGLLKNALNKLVVMTWEQAGTAGYRWWEPIVAVEHFNSLQEITGVLVGEVASLPAVEEGAPYTELALADSPETGAWAKYGGYLGITMEMFERDETHRLRALPNKLASAALRRISGLVASVFTAENGLGPVMKDTKTVFHPDHANLGATALSAESWEIASQAIYNQPLLAGAPAGPLQALDARYCIVPRAIQLEAQKILYPSLSHELNIFSENMQRGQPGDVLTCPEFNNLDVWAAVADPRLAPGIMIGERFGLLPEIYIADSETGGALFTHDEIRMKVRHWVSVFVADYRPLYKANVL